jgi:hypothetical protein
MPSSLVIAAAAAAVCLLLIAVLWRALARRRASRTLERMLVNHDPAVRRSALAMIGGQGLRGCADLLLRRTAEETDTDVLDALAATVARNQWEPADRPALVSLRLWAEQRTGPNPSRLAVAWSAPPPPAIVSLVESALGESVLELTLESAGETIHWQNDHGPTGPDSSVPA